MVSINRVTLAGNLTRDPVVRMFGNDRAVANFSLAINHRYKSADGSVKEDVTYVDIEAWGRTAELVGQYLSKGRSCFIEGRLKLDNWEDKDGSKRSKLKVVADSVQFLGAKPEGEDAPPAPAAPAPRAAAVPKAVAASDADEPPF